MNETGYWKEDLSFCTNSVHCGWTDIRQCYSGCITYGFPDGCTGYSYSNWLGMSSTESGNRAALSFNIIGVILAVMALLAIFVGSAQEKLGKYLRQMVGLSALCAGVAIIAILGGNSGRDECWDDPFVEDYTTTTGPGISFYLEIVTFVVLVIAAYLIHKTYGKEGPSDYTRL